VISAAAAARMMTIGRMVEESSLYSSQDYKAGELIAWAQACLVSVGKSDLAVALLNKVDPHADLACTILGIDLKDFDKKIRTHGNLRQACKVPNFSKPGGGGVPRFVLEARKQGEDTPHPDGPSWIEDGDGNLVRGFKGLRFCVIMRGEYCGGRDDKNKLRQWGPPGRERPIAPTCASCLACGVELEAGWKRKWSESGPYSRFVTGCVNDGMIIEPKYFKLWPWWEEIFEPWQQLDPMQIAQFYSGRIRKVGASAETPFCVLSNTFFQGYLADATKLAHRICYRECKDRTVRVPDMLFPNSKRSRYAGMDSPLYRSAIPVFAHDEMIGEHPRSMASDGAWRISEVMEAALRHVCPDLADAVEAEPTLMECWQKGAEKVVHGGRLVPWNREHNSKTCTECAAEKVRMAA
jgi:hypothetical protein